MNLFSISISSNCGRAWTIDMRQKYLRSKTCLLSLTNLSLISMLLHWNDWMRNFILEPISIPRELCPFPHRTKDKYSISLFICCNEFWECRTIKCFAKILIGSLFASSQCYIHWLLASTIFSVLCTSPLPFTRASLPVDSFTVSNLNRSSWHPLTRISYRYRYLM